MAATITGMKHLSVALNASTQTLAAAAADHATDDTVALIAKLADPLRLQLLYAIHAAPGASVAELAAACGVRPNNASKALTQLKEAGLVTRERRGRHHCWTLADRSIHQLLHQLGAPHSDLHPPHHT